VTLERNATASREVQISGERQLVSLAWIARRWGCSRNTVRRVLREAGAVPFYLGGSARNATIRFDLADVIAAEMRSKQSA
jgi:hypothetical protein